MHCDNLSSFDEYRSTHWFELPIIRQPKPDGGEPSIPVDNSSLQAKRIRQVIKSSRLNRGLIGPTSIERKSLSPPSTWYANRHGPSTPILLKCCRSVHRTPLLEARNAAALHCSFRELVFCAGNAVWDQCWRLGPAYWASWVQPEGL